jgi:UDP-glucose:(heptosyl)LPS alpha-1,3-glucosyltransferase
MRLAFCLFKYFPFGGLQRDFLRIARACVARGHMVDVYTMSWEGEFEPGLAIRTLPAKRFQNHTRREEFVRQLKPFLEQGHYELIVGFNKMPGLDVYYAADTCYQAKVRQQRSWWYRLTNRYRRTMAFEEAVFAATSIAKILLISAAQQNEFMRYYHTQPERFYLLPPGVDKDRMAPMNAAEIRARVRATYQFSENQILLLMVGSGFKTKGLDRALLAIAALPESLRTRTRLIVIGKDNQKPFEHQAAKLGITDKVIFLGGRNDVASFLLAADLLIHPAYNENTGTVLLEALVAGLPVLTTDVCGYAHYVLDASAGKVMASPFHQEQFNTLLTDMLLSRERSAWHANALSFAARADIYSMPERAVSIIEGLR